jgi:hypothetical protein
MKQKRDRLYANKSLILSEKKTLIINCSSPLINTNFTLEKRQSIILKTIVVKVALP